MPNEGGCEFLQIPFNLDRSWVETIPKFHIFNFMSIPAILLLYLGLPTYLIDTSLTISSPRFEQKKDKLMLLKSSLLDLLKPQMKESGQLSRILRRWLPDSKVHNEDFSFFCCFSLFYRLPHRLTALVVASSNQWVWKTQFLLLPSLPPQSLWLSSFSSGNW